MQKFKRILAILLAVMMVASVLPTVLATEGADDNSGDDNSIMPLSLQPLEEIGTIYIDLTDLDPDKLDQVPVKTVLERLNAALLSSNDYADKTVDVENSTVAYAKRYYSLSYRYDEYDLPDSDGNMDLGVSYSLYELDNMDSSYGLTADEINDLMWYYRNPRTVYLILIVGERANDQLDDTSRRYIVEAKLPSEKLSFTFSTDDGQVIEPESKEMFAEEYTESMNLDNYYFYFPRTVKEKELKLSFDFVDTLADKYSDLKVYYAGTELENNEYYVTDYGWYKDFTAVYKDSDGIERTYEFSVIVHTMGIEIDFSDLVDETGEVAQYGSYYYSYDFDEDYIGYWNYEAELKEGHKINDKYKIVMSAYDVADIEAKDADNIAGAYIGLYYSAEEAQGQTDIKEELFGNGYVSSGFGEGVFITVIDKYGAIRRFKFSVKTHAYNINIDWYNFGDESGHYVWRRISNSNEDQNGLKYYGRTVSLRSGYDVNDTFKLTMYTWGSDATGDTYVDNIAGAYIGLYESAEAAKGQPDIKNELFGDGYKSNKFGEGVFITVIDKYGNIQRFKFTAVKEDSSSTDFEISYVYDGEYDGSSERYKTYVTSSEYNKTDNMKEIYQTVFILDTEENIISKNENGYIYPTWYVADGAKVAWSVNGGAAEEKTSGMSPIKFKSGEAILFTVQAENGDVANYYVTFIAQQPEGTLYVLGENVKDSNYDEELGIPGRGDVHLGDLEREETYYDIMFANIGATPLKDISVCWEGTPEYVDIDDYWNVVDGAELGAFDSTYDGYLNYGGVLGNLGKVRLVPTYDENGMIRHGNINGILVIKAGDKTVKLKISGVAGTPKIITESLEDQDAVKWVPYGVIIQSNNVSNKRIAFELDSQSEKDLPRGITLSRGGALYGVTSVSEGKYTFKVNLVYYNDNNVKQVIDSKEFVLAVKDNTDETVYNETDENYFIIQHVGTEDGKYHFVLDSVDEQIFSSNGEFGEFVAFYLDGKLLTLGKDYNAESGSTIITIFDEIISKTADGATHTIAAEFRTDGTTVDQDPLNAIKRAAQNYTIDLKSNEEPDDPDDSDTTETEPPTTETDPPATGPRPGITGTTTPGTSKEPPVMLEDKEHNVTAEFPSSDAEYYADVILVVERETETAKKEANTVLAGKYESYIPYEIRLLKAGKPVQPKSVLTINMPVPKGWSADKTAVYYVSEGKDPVNMNAVPSADGKFVSFSTTHLSTYVLVNLASDLTQSDTNGTEPEQTTKPANPGQPGQSTDVPNTGDTNWTMICVVILMVSAAGVCVVIPYKKKYFEQ